MRYLLIAAATLASPSVRADGVDDAVHAEMAKRQIHGLSIAVVDHGKIVRATGFGSIEVGGAAVTPDTLFQAGSISKSVSALAALHFVDSGKLALDDDVDAKLVGWHLPKSILTDIRKVTLRRILSHTAGLTVHGFPGYAVDEPKPTLVQVLDGVKPANTAPIRVDVLPGVMWRYSGGGYTIMQKLLTDVVGVPFPKLMQDTVLGPAGMTHSSYAQPLPADQAKLTATGYEDPHTKVAGRWHIYPEMAAAGLWTTPSDLVRFGLELGKAYAGTSSIISGATGKRMMSVERDGDGLGVFVHGEGRKLQVGHDGRDEGFDAFFVFYPETGQGLAIMINANDSSGAVRRIIDAVEVAYDWPDKPAPKPAAVAVDRAALDKVAGSYEFHNNDVIHLDVVDGKLTHFSDGLPDSDLIPLAADRFQDREIVFHFVGDAGKVTGLEWTQQGKTHVSPRIAPPLHTLAGHADPDAAFTTKATAALQALGGGHKGAPELAMFTKPARADFGDAFPPIAKLRKL
ncbi:MAG TPA: serine hydrolase domain-containing protein, partial [Kofleriaceae bacterium]|nr:serine hydrolase domain-containing protein [Kofleriaceae bacterium]